MCADVSQVMEVVSRAVDRQEGREDNEWTSGALSHLHLVVGDSRVLGTVSHIWLCEKPQCFVSWTESSKHLGSVEVIPVETGGFSHVLRGFTDQGCSGTLV